MAGYQGRGSKTGAKIIAKSIKEQGGRAGAVKNAAKTAAKAAVFAYNPNKITKAVNAAKGAKAAISVKKTASGVKKTGTITKPAKAESTSFRGSELSKYERKAIKDQNKSAKSMISKDLDAMERGERGAATRRRNQRLRDLGNKAKGSVGTVAVLGSGAIIYGKAKDKDAKNKKKK